MQASEPRRFEFNPARFEELFILLAVGQQDHPMPDFTKLNKAMYLVDFAAFRQEGEPFTGADYLHYEEGPVPAQVTDCINQLALNNDIVCRHKYHVLGDFRHPCVPERFAKTELLPRPLYQMAHQVLELLKHRTPAEATDLFKRDPGWSLTLPGERIPYETAAANSHSYPGFQVEILDRKLHG